jgi:hypothetical protein
MMRALVPVLLLAAAAAPAETITNLPGLVIYAGNIKQVEATGKTTTTDDILEFIAVENGGRDYESLFTLDCRPSAMKFALLLIGCDTNSPVAIEVEWRGKRRPVEECLIDRRTKKSPGPLPWVFTGSYFNQDPISGKEVFRADDEQAFIALWWQPAMLINLTKDFGNPYRGSDQGFEANAKLLPPKDTPVKLILRKREK